MKYRYFLTIASTLISSFSTALAVDWTDWISTGTAPGTSGTNVATGQIVLNGNSNATVSVSGCVQGTVTNGSSTRFSNSALFNPAIAMGDELRTDHTSSMGDFTITFSSPITNPIFHMADRHTYLSATDLSNPLASPAPIVLDIVSGNLAYGNAANTSVKRFDWIGPIITASDNNNFGTTADGTFYMLGTFTKIKLNLSPEDYIYFQIGDDNYVVPEPSSTLLLGIGALVLMRRKR